MASRHALTILVLTVAMVSALQLSAKNLGTPDKRTKSKDADSLVSASLKKVDLETRTTYEMWSGIPLQLALYFEEGFTRDSAMILLSRYGSLQKSDSIQRPVNGLENRQGVRVTEEDSSVVLSVLIKYYGSLSQLDSMGVRLGRHPNRDYGVTVAEFPIELLPQIARLSAVTGIREVRTLAPLN